MLGLALAPLVCDAGEAVHPGNWPIIPHGTSIPPKTEAFVEQLLGSMTLEEKVGQLVQADIDSVTPQDAQTYHLGSILAGGNAAPGHNVRSPASRWLDLADEFFRASKSGPSPSHPPIPALFGIDAVHGHARIPGATVFPHNVGLGAAHDAALVEAIGRATAEEVAATGLDWTFAPTVAVVRDVRWGRSYESYSEDPALVAEYARAMVSGLQGRIGTSDFLAPGHTLAAAKHFIGDGGTVAGRDQFDNRSDEHVLRDVHGAGYPAAISAGALIVMASYNSWRGVKMHANRALLTDVLKGRWDFQGFVVGDWNAQEEIPGCTKYSCPEALNAGLDMYMAPDSWQRLYTNLLEQVQGGRIARARVDDAVRRILRVKVLAGLFEKPAPKERFGSAQLERVGSAAHRAIARQAVRESLVLLKNNGHVLPLDPSSRVLVTGVGADDIGMQSGGWTIDWQGAHNTNADFPTGTSILGGIQAAARAAGGTVVTRFDPNDTVKPSAAIVVYGETPYAEFEGDRETLEFSPGAGQHLEAMERLRAAGIPVISVFISGRPLWVNRELNASNAFVAAWLPGSEGAGVADLLFKPRAGEPPRDFTGRLGFSWPATAQPVTFDDSGVVRGALFQRGYGLTFAHPQEVSRLPENTGFARSLPDRGALFQLGHVVAPWSIYVEDATAQVRLTMQAQESPQGAVSAQLVPAGIRVSWSDRGAAEFRIGGRTVHYRAGQNLAIVARYRVEEAPTQPVGIGVRCEAPYGTPANAATIAVNWKDCGASADAMLDLTDSFRSASASWQTLVIPLPCLEKLGATFDAVSSPFALAASGRFAVSFEDIRLAPATAPSACPSIHPVEANAPPRALSR